MDAFCKRILGLSDSRAVVRGTALELSRHSFVNFVRHWLFVSAVQDTALRWMNVAFGNQQTDRAISDANGGGALRCKDVPFANRELRESIAKAKQRRPPAFIRLTPCPKISLRRVTFSFSRHIAPFKTVACHTHGRPRVKAFPRSQMHSSAARLRVVLQVGKHYIEVWSPNLTKLW